MVPAYVRAAISLALALFMDMGAGRVIRKMAGVLAWAGRGVTVAVPSEEALSNARARLGPAPLRLLFEKAAGPLAGHGGGVLAGAAAGIAGWHDAGLPGHRRELGAVRRAVHPGSRPMPVPGSHLS